MNWTISTFLKFGSERNIRDLFENGTIYINTIDFFRKVEDKELRGDKYEGASRIVNSLPGTFRIPGIDREFKYQKVHYTESFETILGNIYSLYCISSKGFPNPLDFQLDSKNLRFGTHCLMIKNNVYFLEAIEEGLTREGYKFWHGFVDYYDKENISKNLSPFEKSLEFEYQKEFRFYVENDKVEPIKIQIGSLQDYSELHTMDEIMEIKLVPKT